MNRKEVIMIKPVTMYSIVCDRCVKTFIDEFNGIVAWLDKERKEISIKRMTQKYIESNFVRIKTKPNNCTSNKVVYKFINYIAIDKVLIRTINGIDRLVEKDRIIPITLTPSILDKNKWEHKDDVYFKEFPHRKLVIMDENAYIINEYCSMFLCPIKFVHELQHLLFGLGLNSEMEV